MVYSSAIIQKGILYLKISVLYTCCGLFENLLKVVGTNAIRLRVLSRVGMFKYCGELSRESTAFMF